MKQSGLMSMEFKHNEFFCVLTGNDVQVWQGDETDACYMGSIDGLQTAQPELFQAMLDKKAIKAA